MIIGNIRILAVEYDRNECFLSIVKAVMIDFIVFLVINMESRA